MVHYCLIYHSILILGTETPLKAATVAADCGPAVGSSRNVPQYLISPAPFLSSFTTNTDQLNPIAKISQSLISWYYITFTLFRVFFYLPARQSRLSKLRIDHEKPPLLADSSAPSLYPNT